MRSIFAITALVSLIAGCQTSEHRPLVLVDPDPVYRAPIDYRAAPIIQDYAFERVQREPNAGHALVEEPSGQGAGEPITQMAINEAIREAEQHRHAGEHAAMIERYQQAAQLGSMEGHYELARHYMAGDLVVADPVVAIEHLRAADAIGPGEATRVLGWLHLKGNHLARDVRGGEALMRRAALASTRAQRELGMLLCGIYQPNLRDCAEGVAFLKQAADAGDAEAAYTLASKGIVGDEQASWAMQRAADAGHPKAVMLVAERYLDSDGEYAGELYKRAALQGDTEAMMRLANGLLMGKIHAMDAERQAYAWYSVAEALGDDRGRAEKAAIEGARVAADQLQPGAVDAEIQELLSAVAAAKGAY